MARSVLPPLATLLHAAAGRPVALAAINPELATAKQIPFLNAFDLGSGKTTTLFETAADQSLRISPTGRYVVAAEYTETIKFVRDHHRPSFMEYGEYPFVSADEIKKALRIKKNFGEMLDQMQ